jgi:hypothetical protein
MLTKKAFQNGIICVKTMKKSYKNANILERKQETFTQV